MARNNSVIKTKSENMGEISRRAFLKLSVVGIGGLFVPLKQQNRSENYDQQGRVCFDKVDVFSQPSLNSTYLKSYWKDTVFPISEATAGDSEPAHNRVWYYIGDGFVHSGGIQPVRTILNSPDDQIPTTGILGEVTVPFTDSRWRPDNNFPVAYRFYYQTTHWVTALLYDGDGNPWYKIEDDKWKIKYFAPANHIRLVPHDELLPLSAHVPVSAKRIEVRTAEQIVIAYEWDRPVFMTRTATGAKFSNGDFSTPPGRHITAHKRPYRHMAAGNLAYNGYDLPGVPWVTYITESGISFHGTYWHNNYGKPRSHGCINLTADAAKFIYRWTLPVVPPHEQYVYEEFGTAVDVV